VLTTIANEIKRLRLKAGYETLGELYRASTVPVASLSRIEAGLQHPSPKTLKKLAPYLGVTEEHLLIIAGHLGVNNKTVLLKSDKEPISVLDMDDVINRKYKRIRMGGRLLTEEETEAVIRNVESLKDLIVKPRK
jgi:transcriptional regulator with XRE-family HTH domain